MDAIIYWGFLLRKINVHVDGHIYYFTWEDTDNYPYLYLSFARYDCHLWILRKKEKERVLYQLMAKEDIYTFSFIN